MYLSIKQHDQFRTLLMSFELPFRSYIAEILLSECPTAQKFESAMIARNNSLQSYDDKFLRDTLPSICGKSSNLTNLYSRFSNAYAPDPIVMEDIELPMVGGLNIITFAFTGCFSSLYDLFPSYPDYCKLAEKYRYARNKLQHPGTRTLEDTHLNPVLIFISKICDFIDDKYFIQKSKKDIYTEINILQDRPVPIPIKIHNFNEMPFGNNKIVCRTAEIDYIKQYIYGSLGAIRKKHSLCIYGHGGVGKTAVVLEGLKQLIGDIVDAKTVNDYNPSYVLFFSAKKRMLKMEDETGKVIEQKIKVQFSTADELKQLILEHLGVTDLLKFNSTGLIVVDNLESIEEKEKIIIKEFIDTNTPSEMQFIITSRNSEQFDENYKLAGYASEENGIKFIEQYCEENSLEIELGYDQKKELLNLSKGNTLVLVLCLRRLSKNLTSFSHLKADFSGVDIWKSVNKSLNNRMQATSHNVVSQFMFADTFEQLEAVYKDNKEVFYSVLKVFAVTDNSGLDISTLCVITRVSYPEVEDIVNVLCNFLILEKQANEYFINPFAEKYIINRFIPDTVQYDKLLLQINARRNEVSAALEKLDNDIKSRAALANIMKDWLLISDADRIYAANLYRLYQEAKNKCSSGTKYSVQECLDSFYSLCSEAEKITSHPYISYQKARILQLFDEYPVFEEKHDDEIIEAFRNTVYIIRMDEQYSPILRTKSYAALLWIYGCYLSNNEMCEDSIRLLEESQKAFESISIKDDEYYQCISTLGTKYLEQYKKDRSNNLAYLRKARSIDIVLQSNWRLLPSETKRFASNLHNSLKPFGKY